MNKVSFTVKIGDIELKPPAQYDDTPISAEDVIAIGTRLGGLIGFASGYMVERYPERTNAVVRPIVTLTLSGDLTEEQRKELDLLLELVRKALLSRTGDQAQFIEIDGLTIKLYH